MSDRDTAARDRATVKQLLETLDDYFDEREDTVLAALTAARQEEREACAKVAVGWPCRYDSDDNVNPAEAEEVTARNIAAAIRARTTGGE